MTKEKIIDIADLSPRGPCSKGYELQIANPISKQPIGVFITIMGQESDVALEFYDRKGDEKLAAEFERQRLGNDVGPRKMAEVRSDVVDLLAACTKSWRTGDNPTITFEGKALECNEANAKFLYNRERWIKTQVEEAWSDLGNFMPG